MNKSFSLALAFTFLFFGCKKNSPLDPDTQEPNKTSKTIIVSKEIDNSALVSLDSTKLTFNSNASGVEKIKVGSVLVSDMTTVASDGYLRKVSAISNIDGKIVLTTEQAALTDIIEKGNVKFSKTFTDSDIIGIDSSEVDISGENKKSAEISSFNFTYNEVIYDQDKDLQTKNDQLCLSGSMSVQPIFDFELDIDNSQIEKLLMKLSLVNTNIFKTEAQLSLLSLKEQVVLKTFHLKPFTIYVAVPPFPVAIPIPIADQWIAIVLGVDGKVSAKVSFGAQNINTSTIGLIYENNSWSTINEQENAFTTLPFTFEGNARIEPWIMARYEIRPYGLKASRIFLAARGSIISEAEYSNSGLSYVAKWGVKFSAKAQAQILDRTLIDYEKIFFEHEYPFYSKTMLIATLITNSATSITSTSATSGGIISSDGGATVTARGVCWSTSSNPTTSNSKTSDGTDQGSFTSAITGLTPGTTYYLRAYATNSSGTAFGNEISFTTVAGLPTISTSAISSITATSASSGGNVTSSGATVTARSVCWSTSSHPTTSNSKTSDGTGQGSFTSAITGLTPGMTYYLRAYATYSTGTAYGNEISFTTLAGLPTISTSAIFSITSTSASSGGNVTSNGGKMIISRGVCWSTSSNPTTSNSKTTDGTGQGSFTSPMTGLTPGRTYYLRAYATNSSGTAYGNEITFTTKNLTVTDVDGNIYSTVTIGTQVWLASNLKTTRYNDGTPIPLVTNSDAWFKLKTPGYCWYNNDVSNKETYGAMYNWYAVNTAKLCPKGWHVPSVAEWAILDSYTSQNANKLKEKGNSHWKETNTAATDEFGFTLVPAGHRNWTINFGNIGIETRLWSSTPSKSYNSWGAVITGNNCGTFFGASSEHDLEDGLSVRCLRDN